MRALHGYILSFLIILTILIGVETYSAVEVRKNTDIAQEKAEEIIEVKRLHTETIDKINDYYDFKEYEDFTYEYQGNQTSKVNYMSVYAIGSSFEKSVDIVHSDEEPSLEDIEKEFETFRKEFNFKRVYGKYLTDSNDNVKKGVVSPRSIIIAAIIAIFPVVMAVDSYHY